MFAYLGVSAMAPFEKKWYCCYVCNQHNCQKLLSGDLTRS